MADRPTFSVAIPCYNYGGYLARCVGAALEQRDVDVDVLIIDDCSTDDTPSIGQRLAVDPRVTYVRHQTNQGHIATFNEGVDWASNEYFVLVSADDLLAPGAFARAAVAFDRHPSVGLVYGGVQRFSGTIERVDVGDPNRVTFYSGHDWIELRARAADNSTHSPEIMLRTSVQHEAGHYDARCRHTSDLNMWLRVAALADVAYLDDTVQAYYRLHDANMSRVEHGRKLGQIEQRHIAFETFFEVLPAAAPIERWRTLEGRRIAADAIWEASRSIERGEIDGDGVDPYVDLALRTHPDVRRRPGFAGLTLRRRLGPRARYFPPFLMSRAFKMLRRRKQWLDMERRGI